MKKSIIMLTLCLFVCCSGSVYADDAGKSNFETEDQKLSYAFGRRVGNDLKNFDFKIDIELFLQAIREVQEGKDGLMSDEEAMKVVKEFFGKMQAQRQEQRKEAGEKNKVEGEKFLAENKKKKDIKTTESGLQYIVLQEGKGASPQPTDTVKVHYRGTLIDGTEFDSSYSRGEPTEFAINRVIRGWTEGLQLMKEGSKYKFFIPSDLAYGERGAGQQIGPNAVLIFEVELLEVVKDKPKEAQKE